MFSSCLEAALSSSPFQSRPWPGAEPSGRVLSASGPGQDKGSDARPPFAKPVPFFHLQSTVSYHSHSLGDCFRATPDEMGRSVPTLGVWIIRGSFSQAHQPESFLCETRHQHSVVSARWAFVSSHMDGERCFFPLFVTPFTDLSWLYFFFFSLVWQCQGSEGMEPRARRPHDTSNSCRKWGKMQW